MLLYLLAAFEFCVFGGDAFVFDFNVLSYDFQVCVSLPRNHTFDLSQGILVVKHQVEVHQEHSR